MPHSEHSIFFLNNAVCFICHCFKLLTSFSDKFSRYKDSDDSDEDDDDEEDEEEDNHSEVDDIAKEIDRVLEDDEDLFSFGNSKSTDSPKKDRNDSPPPSTENHKSEAAADSKEEVSASKLQV